MPPAKQSLLLIGASAAASKLREDIALAAQSRLNVLLTGETGVGKSLIAACIHRAWAGERERPFVIAEPAALSASLFESELFGHAQGAFTGASHAQAGAFEAANHGTLFLDEIGEIPPPLQVKLLRAVEDKVVKRVGAERPIELDVRIIAATNRNLDAEVGAGNFRLDLQQRLGELPLHVPPLRARREDIVPLFEHFLGEHSLDRRAACELENSARELLEAYHWPGNIRELRSVARRIAYTGLPEVLTADRLAVLLPARRDPARNDMPQLDIEARIANFGRQLYLEALGQHGFNLRQTARALGMPYATLRSRLKALGLISVIGEKRRAV